MRPLDPDPLLTTPRGGAASPRTPCASVLHGNGW